MNRRILNATPVVAPDGTQLKSKLERTVYITLQELGLNPKYESETFTYWTGIKPKTPFYELGKNRHNCLNMKKLIDMKYTPDFIFEYKGTKVLIEVKGWANDQFAIRKKLFRAYLDSLDIKVIYAEIFTKRQLLEFIEELKTQVKEND